jgi:hypothetical protein
MPPEPDHATQCYDIAPADAVNIEMPTVREVLKLLDLALSEEVKRPQHLGGAADSLRATRRYSGKKMRPNGRLAEISAFPRQGSPMKECYDSVRPRGAPSEIAHRATRLIGSEFGFVTEF